MLLALLSASFHSLPLLPTIRLGPCGADSWVGGFVYFLGSCVSLQWTLLWGWSFLLPPQSSQAFSIRGFEALFPCTGTLYCTVCLAPQLFFPVYLHGNVGLPSLPATTSPGLPAAALLHVLMRPFNCFLNILPQDLSLQSLHIMFIVCFLPIECKLHEGKYFYFIHRHMSVT